MTHDTPRPLDSIRLQVIWNRLIAVVEEQARLLMRTAFSPTVREAGDLSAGVFDARARLVAQAVTGTPGHVNSMAAAVGHFLDVYPLATMRPGDHFITNDPWLASGHLHDVTVVSPVFRGERVIAFFACTCHQVDIGGIGQGPDGRSVFEEGLCIPRLPLARAGVINADLIEIIRANVRTPDEVEGDILSYVGANEASGARLVAMLDEFGEDDMARVSDAIIERSRAAMQQAIARLPEGRYPYAMRIDGFDTPVDLMATLEVSGGRVKVDFDGTSPASHRGINVVLNYTRAYAAFGVRAAVAPEVPNNAGSLEPLDISAPEGCILNVQRPWPVCARHIIGQFLPDVVFGALSGVLPERVPAEGASCVWGAQLRGGPAAWMAAGETLPEAGAASQPRAFETLFFNSGGSGARSGDDGMSGTAFPSGVRAIACEIVESLYPVVIWKKELRPDSGGPGRWRGGLGQRLEIASLDGAPFQFFGMYDRIVHAARGREGGGAGAPGAVSLDDGTRLRAMGLQTVPRGRRLCLDLPGGAGMGPANERDSDQLALDVRLGYVSRAAAAQAYGLAEGAAP
ncbi:hydantoinase B/oxoprolinase family protein [Paraburkholderia acidisoli]|uniref:Hydantoinase B/oxoprolinase family protein n=2 Tax=Paraburkholderia acidisoli TaxID=2571748 RepID=A0A7Z2JKV7_9BURK|nr:hydantoinase B/oxoprolinase family protein [Paraburkholderia acidisoli]